MKETPDDNAQNLDHEQLSERDRKIRDLNDQFRKSFEGGQVVMTQGVAALALHTRMRALAVIRQFDEFNEDNDPYGIHDFGSVEVDGQNVWFKIDAYDKDMLYGSPDPSDPKVTSRVMTILLPEDY